MPRHLRSLFAPSGIMRCGSFGNEGNSCLKARAAKKQQCCRGSPEQGLI